MSKVNVQVYKPFGPSISKQDLPLDLIKDFKKDLETIRNLPEKEQIPYRTGHSLAGGLGEKGEFLITPDIMFKWKKNFFDIIIKEYAKIHRPKEEVEKIIINSAWYNVMLKNQWNPTHHHLEYFSSAFENPSISTVGYLSIPKNMQPLTGAKKHNDFSGAIEWIEGKEDLYQFGTYKLLPQERDFFVFPASLNHIVFPHNSNEERISFSFNAVIKFKK